MTSVVLYRIVDIITENDRHKFHKILLPIHCKLVRVAVLRTVSEWGRLEMLLKNSQNAHQNGNGLYGGSQINALRL